MTLALIIIGFLAVSGFLAAHLSITLPYSTEPTTVLHLIFNMVKSFLGF